MSDYLRSSAATGDQIEIEGPIGGFGLGRTRVRH
ncbi:hypothetical protein P9209_03130 [Prescottella defluvii]|nr:hypothetical protein P9209_03130 [Prescottella defluvii]